MSPLSLKHKYSVSSASFYHTHTHTHIYITQLTYMRYILLMLFIHTHDIFDINILYTIYILYIYSIICTYTYMCVCMRACIYHIVEVTTVNNNDNNTYRFGSPSLAFSWQMKIKQAVSQYGLATTEWAGIFLRRCSNSLASDQSLPSEWTQPRVHDGMPQWP